MSRNRRERRRKKAALRKQREKGQSRMPDTNRPPQPPPSRRAYEDVATAPRPAPRPRLRVAIKLESAIIEHYFANVYCPACHMRDRVEVPREIAARIKSGEWEGVSCGKCGQELELGIRLVQSPQDVALEMAYEQQKAQLTPPAPVPHHVMRRR